MHRFIPLIVAVFLAVSMAPGHAKTIKKREANQANRINQGVKRGQLTSKETTRLLHEQSQVEMERRQAMSDGKMTKGERKDIRHDQNRLGKDIHRKRHNKKRVYQ
jgi:hypothetical protein